MESNFIFNLSGTMIKTDDGDVFKLNENCLIDTANYREEFKKSLENRSLFNDILVQELLKGKTLLKSIADSVDCHDICIVDIENEDGFFDGKCQKISVETFLKRYIFNDSKTFVLNKQELMEVLDKKYFLIETQSTMMIQPLEQNIADELSETQEATSSDLYSDELTIDTNAIKKYQEDNFIEQKSVEEHVEELTDKNDDILNYTYEKAPTLETNEETDEVLPMSDYDNDTVKGICGDVMIKDKNNNDVMKAKDLKIDKRCFSSKKKMVNKDILLAK